MTVLALKTLGSPGYYGTVVCKKQSHVSLLPPPLNYADWFLHKYIYCVCSA